MRGLFFPQLFPGGEPLAKPNYSYEKRQRELAKKQKKEEKLKRKLEKKSPEDDTGDRPNPGSAEE